MMLLTSGDEYEPTQFEARWCTRPCNVWLLGAERPVPVLPGDVLLVYVNAANERIVFLDFAERPHRV